MKKVKNQKIVSRLRARLREGQADIKAKTRQLLEESNALYIAKDKSVNSLLFHEIKIKSIDWNNLETRHMDDVYIMTGAIPLIRSFQWQENDIKYLGSAHIMRKNNEGVYNFVPLRSLSNMVTRAIDPRYTMLWKKANEKDNL